MDPPPPPKPPPPAAGDAPPAVELLDAPPAPPLTNASPPVHAYDVAPTLMLTGVPASPRKPPPPHESPGAPPAPPAPPGGKVLLAEDWRVPSPVCADVATVAFTFVSATPLGLDPPAPPATNNGVAPATTPTADASATNEPPLPPPRMPTWPTRMARTWPDDSE